MSNNFQQRGRGAAAYWGFLKAALLASILLVGLSAGTQAQPLLWKATHAGAIRVVGGETRLRAVGGGHWVFLAQPLARSFTVEFEEHVGGAHPEVRLLWNFWPRAAPERA